MYYDLSSLVDVFVNVFVSSEKRGNNTRITDEKFFHFGTCLAQWDGGVLLVNVTKYSATSSKRQNKILRSAAGRGAKVKVVRDVPMWSYDIKKYAN